MEHQSYNTEEMNKDAPNPFKFESNIGGSILGAAPQYLMVPGGGRQRIGPYEKPSIDDHFISKYVNKDKIVRLRLENSIKVKSVIELNETLYKEMIESINITYHSTMTEDFQLLNGAIDLFFGGISD